MTTDLEAVKASVEKALSASTSAKTSHRSMSDVARLLKRMAEKSSQSFPPLPQLWVSWVNERVTEVFAEVQEIFKEQVQQSAKSRTALITTTFDASAVIPGPSAFSDSDSFASKSLVSFGGATEGTAQQKRVLPLLPSLKQFDAAVQLAARQAVEAINRRLFRHVSSKRVAGFGASLQNEAKRVKAELTTRIERLFTDFADDCLTYATDAKSVSSLPVPADNIKQWHTVYSAFCTNTFAAYFGEHKLQLEAAFDAKRQQLVTRFITTRDALLRRNEERLLADADAWVKQRVLAVKAKVKHMTSSPLPLATLKENFDQIQRNAVTEFDHDIRVNIGVWVARETVYEMIKTRLDTAMKDQFKVAVADNQVRVSAFGQSVIEEALEIFGKGLRLVELPIDPAVIASTSKQHNENAKTHFAQRFAGYTAAEYKPFQTTLEVKASEATQIRLQQNTELWQKRLTSVRLCASNIVRDQIFDAGFFSPVHYATWYVKWCLTSAVANCASTASGTVPASVLDDVTSYWLEKDGKFTQLLDRTAWNQTIITVIAALLLLLLGSRAAR